MLGLRLRTVSTRSDLVRSWVTDIAGMGDVDFALRYRGE